MCCLTLSEFYACTHIHTTDTQLDIYASIYVYVYKRLYMYLYIICIYIYMIIHVYVHTCLYTHISSRMHIHIYILLDICLRQKDPVKLKSLWNTWGITSMYCVIGAYMYQWYIECLVIWLVTNHTTIVPIIQCMIAKWPRPIGCLKLQVIFRKRANNYRALLRKMICKDKASYDSTPPCTNHISQDYQ